MAPLQPRQQPGRQHRGLAHPRLAVEQDDGIALRRGDAAVELGDLAPAAEEDLGVLAAEPFQVAVGGGGQIQPGQGRQGEERIVGRLGQAPIQGRLGARPDVAFPGQAVVGGRATLLGCADVAGEPASFGAQAACASPKAVPSAAPPARPA